MKTSAKEATQPDSPWWTIRQASHHHGVDDTTVRRWIAQGLLTANRALGEAVICSVPHLHGLPTLAAVTGRVIYLRQPASPRRLEIWL